MKRHLVLGVLVAVAIFGLCGIAQAGLNDGSVVYYPFNGNANDESGNGNHGTVNGATLTVDRFENLNNAYRFDGSDDFIQLPQSVDLENYDFSISVFFNFVSYPLGENYI